MKRLYAVVLALALCLGLAACGTGNPENDTDDSSTSASDSTGTQDSEGSQTESTASVLYFTGFIGDFGLNDMGWNAANAAAEKYGYDLTLVEFGQDTSQAVASLVDALDTKHYDYVICMSWYIGDTIIEKSKSGEWSDITFIYPKSETRSPVVGDVR